MKTLIIKVLVPDDMNLPLSLIVFQDANIFFRAEKYIEIIPRPTDEEIIKWAESTTMLAASAQNRIAGAEWMRWKYHKEDRE